MSDFSKADEYLVEQVRSGSQSGWAQLVHRYQGRMLAFARSQLRDPSHAEDVVQETFLSFLKSVDRFRTRASLETYLFTILRRRLVDTFRRHGRREEVSVCSLHDSRQADAGIPRVDELRPSTDLSASQVVARQEVQQLQEERLWRALCETIQRLKDDLRLRDLQIFEMVFYGQLRNKEIGEILSLDEKQVALVKHRLIKKLSSTLAGRPDEDSSSTEPLPDESMLTRIWEEHRPSCPKRSTLGKWHLGTLEPEWAQYVGFHVQVLGCRFCQANWQDLSDDTADLLSQSIRDRILHSSVGFFESRQG